MIWFLLGWFWLYVWFQTAVTRARARQTVAEKARR
jgi:hypothetical protein